MTAATGHELTAISKLAAARDVVEAILCGHVAAEVATVEAVVRLTESAAVSLRYRDACLREVA